VPLQSRYSASVWASGWGDSNGRISPNGVLPPPVAPLWVWTGSRGAGHPASTYTVNPTIYEVFTVATYSVARVIGSVIVTGASRAE